VRRGGPNARGKGRPWSKNKNRVGADVEKKRGTRRGPVDETVRFTGSRGGVKKNRPRSSWASWPLWWEPKAASKSWKAQKTAKNEKGDSRPEKKRNNTVRKRGEKDRSPGTRNAKGVGTNGERRETTLQ